MHLWQTKSLIDELAADQLSQWDVTKYLIATTVLWYTLGGLYYDPSELVLVDWIGNILMGVVAACGIYYCFTINRRIDDKAFIVRFTVLSWPVTIRWILISIIVYISFAFVLSGYSPGVTETHYFINAVAVILEVVYFAMLANYFRWIGHVDYGI